jgi:hypothetical protein
MRIKEKNRRNGGRNIKGGNREKSAEEGKIE